MPDQNVANKYFDTLQQLCADWHGRFNECLTLHHSYLKTTAVPPSILRLIFGSFLYKILI